MGRESTAELLVGSDGGPLAPAEVLLRWPRSRPLVALLSSGSGAEDDRISIFAAPSAWRLDEPDEEAIPALRRALATPGSVATRAGRDADASPFGGGWIGCLGYELGRSIEPAASHPGAADRPDDRGWGRFLLARCDDALVHDGRRGRWWRLGEPPALEPEPDPGSFSAGKLRSSLPPDDYLAAVARILELVAAGDLFQANLTQRLTAPFTGSSRHFARALLASGHRYGAYLETPRGTIVSASPELFLRLEGAGGRVRTRPIKGTRPSGDDPASLRDSAKDAAELHMIVDLMRNDLGRVCRYGSVHVAAPRSIETHGTVHHGVAEVAGVLRPEADVVDLLAATFPPGSVTGAPKIRAMQVIESIEPVARGPYCGAIGCFDDDGSATLSVAIRTATIVGGRLDYGAGGGVVADSRPLDEHLESLVKTRVLEAALSAAPPDRSDRRTPPRPRGSSPAPAGTPRSSP